MLDEDELNLCSRVCVPNCWPERVLPVELDSAMAIEWFDWMVGHNQLVCGKLIKL